MVALHSAVSDELLQPDESVFRLALTEPAPLQATMNRRGTRLLVFHGRLSGAETT